MNRMRRSSRVLLVAVMGLGVLIASHRPSTAAASSARFTNIGVVVANGTATYYLCLAASSLPAASGLTINNSSGQQLPPATLSYNHQTCTEGSNVVGYQLTATFTSLPGGAYTFRAVVEQGYDGSLAELTPGYAFVNNGNGSTVATICTVNFTVSPDSPTSLQGCNQNGGAYGNFGGGAPPPPTNTPTATNTPTSTPTNTPTATNTPTSTPTNTPTATNTPTSTPTNAQTAKPTFATILSSTPTAGFSITPAPAKGGAGHTKWTAHAFFAEGYTGLGYQEYLSLLNLETHSILTRVAIHQMDGVVRTVTVRLAASSRYTMNMNALAPRMSTALKVDAEGRIVAERAVYYGNGYIVAGAPQPSRQWYVAENYVGLGFSDGLRIFNPAAASAVVTIASYRSDGMKRVSYRTVASGARINVLLNDVAPVGGSAVVVQGNVPLVVENVVKAKLASGPAAALAIASPSRTWYFPDGGTSAGNKEYVTVFNPQSRTAVVRLHPVTTAGSESPVTFRVRPQSRAVFVVQGLIRRPGLALIVDADRAIAAQEVRYTSGGGVSIVNGAAQPTRAWAMADGYSGHGFKEWVTILNPGQSTTLLRVRIMGPHGVHVVRLRVLPHRMDYLYVGRVVPNGPVAVVAEATHPVVVGRTLIFNAGKGLSTTTGVPIRVH